MVFHNAALLWLVPVVPVLLLGLAWWSWESQRDLARLFPLDLGRAQTRHIEKYLVAGALSVLLVLAMAQPELTTRAVLPPEKGAEVALLVDVSGSMGAVKTLGAPSRLERAKKIALDLVSHLEERGQPRIGLFGFTMIARSHVPFVGRADYAYLKESISKILGIYSVPGNGTSLGQAVLNIVPKFSKDQPVKLIVMISDGEIFAGATTGMRDAERTFIEQAVQKAREEGIRIITVGVGEREGAKIPVWNDKGEFTGEFISLQGVEYVTRLDEQWLQELSDRTEGKYWNERDDAQLLPYLDEQLSASAAVGTEREITLYRSLSSWLVAAALPLLVVLVGRHLIG